MSCTAILRKRISRPSSSRIRRAIRSLRSASRANFIFLSLKTPRYGNNSLRGRRSFLQQQLEDARASLSAQDAKVRQFEAQHGGTLPDQEQSNLQILAGMRTELQNEQDALNAARQQKTYLQAMLQQERANATKAEAARSAQGAAPGQPTWRRSTINLTN